MFSSFKFAIKALKANKTRSLLAVLGVIIGISAVIIVVSAGEGLRSFILGQIEVFGSDTIEVEVKVPNVKHTSSENATSMVSGVSITTFKNKDLEALKKSSNVQAIYGGQIGQDLISYKNVIKKITLFSTTSDFSIVDKSELEVGRFFTEPEDLSLKQVVVLGSKVRDKLFGNEDPVNKDIQIGKLKFKVIGSMKARGAVGFFDMDDQVFIPLRTYQKKIAGTDHLMFAFMKVRDVKLIDDTVEELRQIMRQQHSITDPEKDDFAVISMTEASSMMDTVINGIIILLIALVTVSLIVGGVGIMNIMYISVIERTFEIGLRKAVGARKSDILRQFLWEAVIITLIGGILGIAIGVAISFAISYLATLKGFKQSLVIPIKSVIMAFGFSAVVGLVFGIYPARKAAELNPIEALIKE